MPPLVLASQGIVKMIHRLPLFTFPVLLIILLGSGCSMIQPASSYDSDPTQDQANMPPNQPMILVDIQPKESRGSTQRIPLAQAPTLQAAVDQSKAGGKFKRFHIAVSRLPQYPGGQPQKLVSKYDHIEKAIPFEYDYQLQAGDRVVIVEDPSNTMDDIFGGIVGPLRAMAGGEAAHTSPF
ncbi:hypothetical protein C5Y97_26975 [Blastopirellula marina]|uniref:Uncharacterized protein n=2 Tax=Blastopirellula marina TaxID=124 RepID=A0A2S8F6E9_9BACT|nr:hypothetical protein C5Y98_26960 [Blastopirellula marina]PTL41478.1 hypothetical protein C5Y97_26975 [Blastopirellula marina]